MNQPTQSRLLQWAGLFLFLQSAILTLAPAVRERTWDAPLRFSHWIGFAVWCATTYYAHRVLTRRLPESDPYLFPAAALLSGWGLLTIWRLAPNFGLRQTLWHAVGMAAFAFAVSRLRNLSYLKNYKYLFLSGGLLITALTLIFGKNPMGGGPRLWLAFGDLYLQPSEPLKILLAVYLSAYLAERSGIRLSSKPLLAPTLFVTGIALLLLVVQRDLGAAFIFVFIFTIFIFIASGKRRTLLAAGGFLVLALALGYFSIDVIHARMVGWLDPWRDPSGNSYQIIQSLLAIANGGVFGRGLGIGNPSLVPVALSDFIFSAIAEESGLLGVVGLIAAIWLILSRGILAALRAPDNFRRYLAAGVSAYLGAQSLLIIGGNLRLFPLTGVTLPFVSYGGSSLLTSFAALYLLIVVSATEDEEPAPLSSAAPYSALTGIFLVGFSACVIVASWWALVRDADLLERTDNARRAIADRYVPRGALLDSANRPIDLTRGQSGSYLREYFYPSLAPITGYTHPVYGQAGLEASLDDYLRGLDGNPSSLIFWNELLYGTPPPGLDVRLSLDLDLQTAADSALGTHRGAVVLLNANSGEILVMASHPTYDPNQLGEIGEDLAQDASSPLLNRAAQGLYPLGDILLPLVKANFGETRPSDPNLLTFYEKLGLFSPPLTVLPVATNPPAEKADEARVSPLQVGLAAATLSARGIVPAPRIATAIQTEKGWLSLSALGQPKEALTAKAADEAALALMQSNRAYWSRVSQATSAKQATTWLIAGTPPNWKGAPLVLVVALEEDNPALAQRIADSLLGGK